MSSASSPTPPAGQSGVEAAAAATSHPKLSAAIPTTVGTILTVAFFAAHQAWSTGFFLSSFGPIEAGLFYASIIYAIVVTNTTVFGVREDRALVLDLAGGVLWTITTVWLYFVFPFDFAHFAAVVPWPLQFLFTWVTNSVGRIIWTIFVLGSAAFIPFFAIQLKEVRTRSRRGQ